MLTFTCPFASQTTVHSPTWEIPYNGHAPGQVLPHYFMGGDVVPVTVVGELPCTLESWPMPEVLVNHRPAPMSSTVLEAVIYALDCESVLVHEADSKTTVHTMLNASSIFYDQGVSGDSVIYVCDPNVGCVLQDRHVSDHGCPYPGTWCLQRTRSCMVVGQFKQGFHYHNLVGTFASGWISVL